MADYNSDSQSVKTKSYQIEDIYINISVGNPVVHNSWEEGQYTSYAINIETNNPCFSLMKSSVRRRYSEFAQLSKLLKTQHQVIQIPSLPSRSLFKNRFSVEFIEQRRQGLEIFLQKLFAISLCLSNKTLHLFSQSNLSMDDISSIVVGGVQKSLIVSDVSSVNKLHVNGYNQDDTIDYDSENYRYLSDLKNCKDSISTKDTKHVTFGSNVILCTPSLHVPSVHTENTDDSSLICSYTPPLSDITPLPPKNDLVLHNSSESACKSTELQTLSSFSNNPATDSDDNAENKNNPSKE